MSTTITMSLSLAQAQALEWIVAYGIDEKEYVLNSHLVRDYNASRGRDRPRMVVRIFLANFTQKPGEPRATRALQVE